MNDLFTMFPLDLIEQYALKNGWTIHRIERTISASKTNRRKQEEWIVYNYEAPHGRQTSPFKIHMHPKIYTKIKISNDLRNF